MTARSNNASEQAIKGPKRHQAVSGYWHSLATLTRYCRVRSYLVTSRNHGIRPVDAIREIDCPTKILRGERSKVTSAAAAAELAELIPGASWTTISHAGHTIQSSNPAGLAAEVVAFLDRLPPTDTAPRGTHR